jgi:hypothetical protein
MSLTQTIRVVGDLVPGRNLIDLNTGKYPFFWSGNKILFLIALENSGVFLDDFSNLESFTLQIRPSTGNSSPQKGSDPVMSKTVTSFYESLTEVEWKGGVAGHIEISFDGSLSAVPAGPYWISLTALVSGSLYNITFGAGPVRVIDNGYASCASLVEASRFAWSRDESDLRYVKWDTLKREKECRTLLQEAVPLLSLSTIVRETSAYNSLVGELVEANVLRTVSLVNSHLQMGLIEEERENLFPYSQLLEKWNIEGSICLEDGYSIAPDHIKSAARVFGSIGKLTYSFADLDVGDYVFSFYSRNGVVLAQIWAEEILLGEILCPTRNKWGRNVLCIRLDMEKDVSVRFVSEENIDVELWGIQLEKGNAVSSYIHTEGSTVVRSMDEVSVDLSFLSDSVLSDGEGTLLLVCYDCQFAESQLYISSASSLFNVSSIFANYDEDGSIGFSTLTLDKKSKAFVVAQIFEEGAIDVYGEGEYGVTCPYTEEIPELAYALEVGEEENGYNAPNGWILPLYWAKALNEEQLGLLCGYFHEQLELL